MLGYPITLLSVKDCVKEILSWIDSGQKGKYFVCANPHSIVISESDPLFKKAIKNADLITPDGVGIVIASILFGGKIRRRVTGSDIFTSINRALNNGKNYSVFFLGSTEENLSGIQNKMAREYPDVIVVGTYSPPFKQEFSEQEMQSMIEAVNKARPDVLWIGMTAPKQEKWIYQNKHRLQVKFIGAVGAVFDFYVGKVKRSHPIFLDTGLEWLPRMLQQPQRLWRRNLISAPKFLLMVIKERLLKSHPGAYIP
jgi:N-acetylglucosaminyldiphosphoundecaprenol N-acetyl-beta-D-mannosaminyltransferase